ncbi:hypothetical protein MPER_08640, partial [Moniliophthora perniciosa FA553]
MASTSTTLLPIAPAPPNDQLHTKQQKRKRPDDPDSPASNTASGSTASRKPRDGPKKKKAAHLTCNDSRPCDRCIKRGIAANCTEGHRKKAKYLLDDEEL